MRRRRLAQLQLDLYPQMSMEEKQDQQELVFVYYYDRNGEHLESALMEIREDLIQLELNEKYERCLILKDILDRFE